MTNREAPAASERPTPIAEAVRAGWQAALDCHSRYGMAGWSSHRDQYLAGAIAASAPQAVRMLTREELADAFYNEQRGDDIARVRYVLRKFCKVNGIVPLSPQDSTKEGTTP